MKIEVDIFNEKSIDKAIGQIEKYSLELEKAMHTIARQLADIGVEVVDYHFSTVGEGGYSVLPPEETENGYIVQAVGDNVVFIEFGTGVKTEDYERESQGLPTIAPGSYSQTEGKGYFVPGEHEYWYYLGKKYTGTPHAHGFYEAKKKIQEEAERIVREVLSKL